jgi:Flp pilus assembly protein TadD
MHSNPGGWKPPGFPRPDGFYPPFCGFYLQAEWSGGGGGTYGASDLGPGSWPETLPPGMTRRQAKAHDFAAEIHRARIRECQALLAANPTDQEALLEMAWAYRRRGEHAGAAAAFEKLLTTDCNDGSALNTFIWYYIEHGGTNLHCALRAARKAWDLGPQDAYLIDTIGWVFFKYGDYERALYMFKQIPGGSPDGNLDVLYRSGLAHYMTGDQREARRIFEPLKKGPQAVEIQKCLEVLDIQDPAPNAVSEAKLRARLAEVPDDPVALSRLAAMYEGVAEGQQAREPLVRKALGFTACHRSEYARALEYLKEAAQGRPEDGELFLVLGMVCQQLGQEKDAIQWLRKALSLKLKFSSRDQANEMLAPLTATGAQPAPASPE